MFKYVLLCVGIPTVHSQQQGLVYIIFHPFLLQLYIAFYTNVLVTLFICTWLCSSSSFIPCFSLISLTCTFHTRLIQFQENLPRHFRFYIPDMRLLRYFSYISRLHLHSLPPHGKRLVNRSRKFVYRNLTVIAPYR